MRYYIYYWTKSDITEYENDYGEFDLLPNLYSSLIQYGSLIGKTNSEEEAYKICDNKADKMRYDECILIWDSYEKRWFN